MVGTPLQLEFGGAGGHRAAPALSWREGRFANWTLVLGERRFRLHKFLLARASGFLEGAMAEVYDSSQTDLTGILPRPCWPFFEDLLDVVYGEGKEEPERKARAQARAEAGEGVLSQMSAVPLLAA